MEQKSKLENYSVFLRNIFFITVIISALNSWKELTSDNLVKKEKVTRPELKEFSPPGEK